MEEGRGSQSIFENSAMCKNRNTPAVKQGEKRQGKIIPRFLLSHSLYTEIQTFQRARQFCKIAIEKYTLLSPQTRPSCQRVCSGTMSVVGTHLNPSTLTAQRLNDCQRPLACLQTNHASLHETRNHLLHRKCRQNPGNFPRSKATSLTLPD